MIYWTPLAIETIAGQDINLAKAKFFKASGSKVIANMSDGTSISLDIALDVLKTQFLEKVDFEAYDVFGNEIYNIGQISSLKDSSTGLLVRWQDTTWLSIEGESVASAHASIAQIKAPSFSDQDILDLATSLEHANSDHASIDDLAAAVEHANSDHADPNATSGGGGAISPIEALTHASPFNDFPEETTRYVVSTDGDAWPANGLLINTRDATHGYQQLVTVEGVVSRSWDVGNSKWFLWTIFGSTTIKFVTDGVSTTYSDYRLQSGAYDVIYGDSELARGDYTQSDGSFTLPFAPPVGSILWAKVYSGQEAQANGRSIFISDQDPDPVVGVDGDVWFKFY